MENGAYLKHVNESFISSVVCVFTLLYPDLMTQLQALFSLPNLQWKNIFFL